MAVCQPSVPVLAAAALMDEAIHRLASLNSLDGRVQLTPGSTDAVTRWPNEGFVPGLRECGDDSAISASRFIAHSLFRFLAIGPVHVLNLAGGNSDSTKKEFFNHLVDGDGI